MAKKKGFVEHFLFGGCNVNQSASIKMVTLTFRKDFDEVVEDNAERSTPKRIGTIKIKNVAEVGETKRANEWSEEFDCSVKEKFTYALSEDKPGKYNLTVQINDCPIGSILQKLAIACGNTMKLEFVPAKVTKTADLDKEDVKLSSKDK